MTHRLDMRAGGEVRQRRRQQRPVTALTLIATSVFLAMSVWFSASFVAPQLANQWGLSSTGTTLLTIGVQIGFLFGALGFAVTGITDTMAPRHLMTVGAFGAALANTCLLWTDGIALAVALRLMTGICLAAIYPPALKEVATWFQARRGTAMGVMIAALTLGSSLPHLIQSLGTISWQHVIVATSVMTVLAGLIVTLVRQSGPYATPRQPFRISAALDSFRNRDVVLADIGYMGHMWELYAMWSWIGAYLAALPAIANRPNTQTVSAAMAFACIAVGAVGCLVGGRLGDRIGRARSALLCLTLSGSCAIVLSALGTDQTWLVITICLIWGFWVIADSAQFSALVTDRADPRYVGSAVSIQLALGYATTIVSVWLIPLIVAAASWSVALLVAAIGPVFGVAATVLLARSPTRETDQSRAPRTQLHV